MKRHTRRESERARWGRFWAVQGGFSLIELMVAMGISFVVVGIATKITADMMLQISRVDVRNVADEEVKLLTEYLAAETQVAGGGGLRPWMGLKIYDAGGADGKSDKLLLVTYDYDSNVSCSIKSNDGINFKFYADDVLGSICCLDPDNNGTPNIFDDSQVITVSADQSEWKNWTVKSYDISTGPPRRCRAKFENVKLLAAPLDNNAGGVGKFDLGQLMVVRVRMFQLTGDVLEILEDDNYDGVFEKQRALDHVYDLQFALGYDVDGDGVVLDDGSTGDEWLFNAVGDAWNANGLTGVLSADLRMFAVGVIIGERIPNVDSFERVLNNNLGVARTDTLLRRAVTRVALRNMELFF